MKPTRAKSGWYKPAQLFRLFGIISRLDLRIGLMCCLLARRSRYYENPD